MNDSCDEFRSTPKGTITFNFHESQIDIYVIEVWTKYEVYVVHNILH